MLHCSWQRKPTPTTAALGKHHSRANLITAAGRHRTCLPHKSQGDVLDGWEPQWLHSTGSSHTGLVLEQHRSNSCTHLKTVTSWSSMRTSFSHQLLFLGLLLYFHPLPSNSWVFLQIPSSGKNRLLLFKFTGPGWVLEVSLARKGSEA